jgi:hypothetical protein
MNARPEDFHVRDGEPVRPALIRFAKLVTSQMLRSASGADLRIHRGEQGIDVVSEPLPAQFRGAFWVSLTSPTRCRVGEGLIGGLRPVIDGRYLDGTLPPDGEQESPSGPPDIDLSREKRPTSRSYIVAAIAGNPIEQGLVSDPTLLHRGELLPDRSHEWPVAEFSWQQGRVVRVRQILYFDQDVSYSTTRKRWVWRSV